VRWSPVIVAKHLLVILDSCASGLAVSAKVGESPEERRQMEANSLSGEGSGFLITAGTEAQKAYQLSLSNQKGYSVLTHALLTALRQGQNDDAFMTINEVFGKAQKSVASFNADEGKNMDPPMWPINRQDGEAPGTFVFVNINAKNPPVPPISSGIVAAKGDDAENRTETPDPNGQPTKQPQPANAPDASQPAAQPMLPPPIVPVIPSVLLPTARVVFFAPHGGNSIGLSKPSIYINGDEYARIENGTFFYINLPQGDYTFCVGGPKKGCVLKTVKNKELTYVKVQYPPISYRLTLVDADTGEQMRKEKAPLPVPEILIVKKDSVETGWTSPQR